MENYLRNITYGTRLLAIGVVAMRASVEKFTSKWWSRSLMERVLFIERRPINHQIEEIFYGIVIERP